MKRVRLTALLLVLTFAAIMALPGCQGVSNPENDKSIIETEYLVDKETGEFTAVVILQNNEQAAIRENMYMADAYDENGNMIEAKTGEHDGQELDYSLFDTCCWLSSGEKTALVFSSALTNDGTTILDHYTQIPDSIKWNTTGVNYDGKLEPHGLSITDYSDISSWEYPEYEITIRNDSNTDYTVDTNLRTLKGDMSVFYLYIVVVYRDSEGNIKDVDMTSPFDENEEGIAAGSETTYAIYSTHAIQDDLTPEFYIKTTWWQ